MDIYVPNKIRLLAEGVADDFGKFAYDGFGVMLSTEQEEAIRLLGMPGPRKTLREKKINYVSGGQRGGKTVLLALAHARACLYKQGVDNTDAKFWRNYLYRTLAGAPTTELTLKLWTVMDELSKGASDAQWDKQHRSSRGGAFIHLLRAGKSGEWPTVFYENGAMTDFRSTEGWAYRLEGSQWWFLTWDEWASQPDREIEFVLTDVLMGRSRDHDAKIVPAAWPKEQTERHLISAIRKIEAGEDVDSQVIYISSENAYFTNFDALAAERRRKSDAQWKRTVLGRPAGGASVEFKPDLVSNAVRDDLPPASLPEEGYRYLSAWDIGLAHDATVGITFRIPLVGVTPDSKARIVNTTEIKASDGLTLDHIAFAIAREQHVYNSQTAVDASGLGGVAAFRQLRELRPSPLSFVARSNDRLWGNMRLASITNALDMLSWGRPDETLERSLVAEGKDVPAWGMLEMPRIQKLLDQLANFDRDAKGIADDWVFSLLIGLWYIRRFYALGDPGHVVRVFDPRVRSTRRAVPLRRRAVRIWSAPR